jgi:5-methylcytosine-specific restriction endonuclease McrA
MQHLPFPVTVTDDEAVLTTLAKQPQWAPHKNKWVEAYRTYHRERGSPFRIVAIDLGQGIPDLQYNLYDARRKSGEIDRMRRKEGLLSCPMCGSPVTGSLDHYLPRNAFPEFSIMCANLIPACTHCNSGVKRKTVHGEAPCRFIHPYFDAWAADELWFVAIEAPYTAPTFRPAVSNSLTSPNKEIVAFHLNNTLGDQFHLSMGNEFSTYPDQILARMTKLNRACIKKHIQDDLNVAVVSLGRNSWKAAFLRGLLSDRDALNDVLQRTQPCRPAAPGYQKPS